MTITAELSSAAATLRSARFTGAMTATPAVAALVRAREPLAKWLISWGGIELEESGPLPEDAQHALSVARAINGRQA
ncbi:hypothetical protein [Streptomyces griseorubiginosus]|uniref:hypothetical protein n=1 Tax=Streptomyces griseorubiginosus TaxID=67304 RepID=UPI003318441F